MLKIIFFLQSILQYSILMFCFKWFSSPLPFILNKKSDPVVTNLSIEAWRTNWMEHMAQSDPTLVELRPVASGCRAQVGLFIASA